MTTTRKNIRDRVNMYLDDIASLFEKAELDAWMDEGLRRLSPVLLAEKDRQVQVAAGVDSVSLPDDCVYVLRVYAEIELPSWREHGGELHFSEVVNEGAATTVTVEYLGGWDAMAADDAASCPLADWQADVLVFYTVARAFRRLATNRADYRRYATVMNNQVDLEDIERLAATWQADFEAARLEARTRRQLLYEGQRVAGSRPEGE
jgi:hypothetical protein